LDKQTDFVKLHETILKIKKLLCELENNAESFPALNRNSKRALASLKMIELNVSDAVQFELIDV
jgi:hypothetical protein